MTNGLIGTALAGAWLLTAGSVSSVSNTSASTPPVCAAVGPPQLWPHRRAESTPSRQASQHKWPRSARTTQRGRPISTLPRHLATALEINGLVGGQAMDLGRCEAVLNSRATAEHSRADLGPSDDCGAVLSKHVEKSRHT